MRHAAAPCCRAHGSGDECARPVPTVCRQRGRGVMNGGGHQQKRERQALMVGKERERHRRVPSMNGRTLCVGVHCFAEKIHAMFLGV